MSFAPQLSAFAVFFAAALVIALTPGPGIFYVGARTLAGGREEGMASSLGTGLGGLVHVIAGAVGLSAVVMASAEAFTVLKIAGALYLIWLGINALRQGSAEGMPEVSVTGVLDPQGKAIGQALHGLGFAGVGEVRAGKVIELELAETDPAKAKASAEEMARKLLANTVIESFKVEIAPGVNNS